MDKDKKELLNELLVKIRQGDDDSIGIVHDIMAPTVRYIALKYLRTQNEADDAVQDFWMGIRKYASTFLVPHNAYGYLCRIVTRQVMNRLKKTKRDVQHNIEYVDYRNIDNFKVEENAEIKALRDDINAIIADLPKLQRLAIQETFFEEKSERQIAREFGLSKSMVSRMKNKGIETLKRELTKRGWDESDI